MSRILLPVGTGRVAFATAVVTYFAMFAQLGIPTYGIWLCAKVRDNKEELTRVVHELLFINTGAVYKVGNSALINMELFEKYLERFREPVRELPKHTWNKLKEMTNTPKTGENS